MKIATTYEEARNNLIPAAAKWADGAVSVPVAADGDAAGERLRGEWNRLFLRRMDELAFAHRLSGSLPRADRYRAGETDPFSVMRKADWAAEKAISRARAARAECMSAVV